MDNKHEQIKTEFIIWLKQNKQELPINAFCWDVQLVSEDPAPKDARVELGKYNSSILCSNPFYRPYSKMITF